ncbi:LOW QUALITY PROTEIN: uncharacterized protein LOC141749490 [Larus michahellis]|uniref:LOW QUALITY PROTEIN: uncharacterized protein LOC141749490 n=1 Tax=Larus michahellis TaxID=119627 RepID=UPI003D9BD385
MLSQEIQIFSLNLGAYVLEKDVEVAWASGAQPPCLYGGESNCFPRAAHSHPVHPPGCLAWIEAWVLFSPHTCRICYWVGASPKIYCCGCWNSSRPWAGDTLAVEPTGDGAGTGSTRGCWWRCCVRGCQGPEPGLSLSFLPSTDVSLVVFCRSLCPCRQDLPSLASSREMVCLHPPGMSVCPPPLLVSHDPPCPPSPHGGLLMVCLLSPCSQDSCSQDSNTEMVGCSARLMPGFPFSRWCFSACCAPGTPAPSPPWGVGTVWGCCNEGQPCNEMHFGAAGLFLRCELKLPHFSWHAVIFDFFSSFFLSGGGKRRKKERKKKKKRLDCLYPKSPKLIPKGPTLAGEHLGLRVQTVYLVGGGS